MKNGIPKSPEKLVLFLDHLITGDDKHQADHPLPMEDRAVLVATRDELKSRIGAVQTSKGQVRTSTNDRNEYLATAVDVADRLRASVVRLYGSKASVLVDYALAARRNPRKGEAAANGGAKVRQEERAKVHLAKMRAQLDKAKERMSRLEASIATQETKVASAREATPHEPTSVSGPTSESGTK